MNHYVQAINRLVACELPITKDRVRATEPWTIEGKEARNNLLRLFLKLRQLAKKTGNAQVRLGVAQLISVFRQDLPNWDDSGSLN